MSEIIYSDEKELADAMSEVDALEDESTRLVGSKQNKTSHMDGDNNLERKNEQHCFDTNYWGAFNSDTRQFEFVPQEFSKAVINEALAKLAFAGADDVHIVSDRQLFAKIDNVTSAVTPRRSNYNECSDLLAEMHLKSTPGAVKSKRPQSFAYSVPIRSANGTSVDQLRFRVQATGCMGIYGSDEGLSLVCRVIEPTPQSMDALGIPDGIRDLAFPDSGIVLISGETGSGKTTILGSFIYEEGQASLGKSITCYEDPPELDYQTIPNLNSLITQTDVKGMLLDWSDAVPDALRRNPDIILIGEVRDAKTIKSARLAAVSGHRVYTTVHTNSVEITIPRMCASFDAGEHRAMMDNLTDACRGIIHQRLLKHVSGRGRVPIQSWLKFDADVRRTLFGINPDIYTQTVYRLIEERGHPLLKDLMQKKDEISPIDFERVRRELESSIEPTEVNDA
jgi:defect-in-organelle-trafficking protein DotB